MNEFNSLTPELADLLEAVCLGELSPEQAARLEKLIAEDREARRHYVRFVSMHAMAERVEAADPAREARALELAVQAAAEVPNVKPRSPVLSFLGSFANLGNRVAPTLSALVLVALSAVFMLVIVVVLTLRGTRVPIDQPQIAQNPTSPERGAVGAQEKPANEGIAASSPVARLVRTYDCVWSGESEGDRVAEGGHLKAGERLRLRSGLAEIQFDCGARAILQGPASLLLESSRAVSLFQGKVTVRAETDSAKGFAIHSPGMNTVDLGTEFGLEVSPAGMEQVHVFRGEVVVSPSLANGPSVAPQYLTASQGIEVNPDTCGVKLVANNGERFARSLDEVDKKRHVVAYWRFEDHAVGVVVPDVQKGKALVRGSLDSSLNGNDLYAWRKDTQPSFSGDVPAKTVARTGEPNGASLDNSMPLATSAGMVTRDLFSNSEWSRPSPIDLQTITPVKWTVEASVKPVKLRKEHQTILVRDGVKVSKADPKLAPFALQVNPDRHFEVLFCDVTGRNYKIICEALTVEENRWYHLAATSDGAKLKLYVDSRDGKGYCLWSVMSLPESGSTALARGVWPANPPAYYGHRYIWSLGRGYYGGRVCSWFQGLIDEVRICDVALEPSEFLFSPRVDGSNAGLQTAQK